MPMSAIPNSLIKQPTVFFDRDGTLNVEKGYIRTVEDIELYPNVAQAVKKLNDAGILCILTTNQTGAGRGFYDLTHIEALNQRVCDLLHQQAGAWLDAVYYSPYYARAVVPEFARDSDCRKPNTGMIKQAQQRFPQIDLTQSFVFGDKPTDVELAHNAGCRGILLRTGYGANVLAGKYQSLTVEPWAIADSTVEAVELVLATLGLSK
jgi:D-glycero-D-manno-heptose 1,7-bisphosphate phosphatase